MTLPARRCATLLVLVAVVMSACSDRPARVHGPLGAGDVALQDEDLPGDVARCEYSATMPRYLADVRTINNDDYVAASGRWRRLVDVGAIDGFATVYAESDRVCDYWLTGPPAGRENDVMRVASSVVVRFPDAAASVAAYEKDVFSQTTIVGAEGFRVEQGETTGLGPNSIVAVEGESDTGATQAIWQEGPFNIFLSTRHLTNTEVDTAVAAVKARASAS